MIINILYNESSESGHHPNVRASFCQNDAIIITTMSLQQLVLDSLQEKNPVYLGYAMKSHKNPPETMKNPEPWKTMKNHENPPGIMKNQLRTQKHKNVDKHK